MLVNRNAFKNSESFKNVEKDLSYIVSKIIEDEQLLKLLSLKENQTEKLTAEEKKKILNKCINIVPKVYTIDKKEPWSYINIVFDTFTPNETNTEYRNKILYFDIVCDWDTWNMGDFKLRPYLIAGRLDAIFNKKPLNNGYSIEFIGSDDLSIDDSLAGLILVYMVTYGNYTDRRDN
jgi:hypothetical protein